MLRAQTAAVGRSWCKAAATSFSFEVVAAAGDELFIRPSSCSDAVGAAHCYWRPKLLRA